MAVQDDTQLRSKVEKMTGLGTVELLRYVSRTYGSSLSLTGRFPELGIAYCNASQRLSDRVFKDSRLSKEQIERYGIENYLDTYPKTSNARFDIKLSSHRGIIDNNPFKPCCDTEIILAFEFAASEYKRLLGKSTSGRKLLNEGNLCHFAVSSYGSQHTPREPFESIYTQRTFLSETNVFILEPCESTPKYVCVSDYTNNNSYPTQLTKMVMESLDSNQHLMQGLKNNGVDSVSLVFWSHKLDDPLASPNIQIERISKIKELYTQQQMSAQ